MAKSSSSPKARQARHQVAVTLRKLMEQRDWSERDLEKASGIGQKTINDIVNEISSGSVETVRALAHALQMSDWQLLVWGRAESDASSKRLDEVVYAYLVASPEKRKKFDTLAASVD